MTTYSTSFFLGNAPTTLETVYTVPASSVVVLRDIEVSSGDAADHNLYVVVARSGSASTVVLLEVKAEPNWVQWQGRIVLDAGDELQLLLSPAGITPMAISGYLLSS